MNKKELQERIFLLINYDIEKTSDENLYEQKVLSQKYIPAERSTTETPKINISPSSNLGDFEKLSNQNPSSNIEQSENIKTWMKNNSSFSKEDKKDTNNVLYFNFLQSLQKISDKLLAKDEEVVVPILNQLFNKYGFKFEESGLLDNVTIIAPNKSKKEFKIDFWTSEDTHNALMAAAIIGSVAVPFLGPTMAIASAGVSVAASLADSAVYAFVDDDPWMAGFSLIFALIPFDELYRLLGGKYSIEVLKNFSKKVLNKKFAQFTEEEFKIINELKKDKDILSKEISKWWLKRVMTYEFKQFFKGAKLKNIVRYIYLFSKIYPKIYSLTKFGINLGGVYYSWSVLANKLGIEKKEIISDDFDPETLLDDDITNEIAIQLVEELNKNSTPEERDSILNDWVENNLGKNVNDVQINESIKIKNILFEAVLSPQTIQNNILRVFRSSTVEETIDRLTRFIKKGDVTDYKLTQLFKDLRNGTKRLGNLPTEEFNWLLTKMDMKLLVRVLWDDGLLFSKKAQEDFLNKTAKIISENPESASETMTKIFSDRLNLWGLIENDPKYQELATEYFFMLRNAVRSKIKPDILKRPDVSRVFQESFENLEKISTKSIEKILIASKNYLKQGFFRSYFMFLRSVYRKWNRIDLTSKECIRLSKTYLSQMEQGNTLEANKILEVLQGSMDNLASQYKGYLNEFMIYLDDAIIKSKDTNQTNVLTKLKEELQKKKIGESWETLLEWDKLVREKGKSVFGLKYIGDVFDEAYNSFRYLSKSVISVVRAIFSKKSYQELSAEQRENIKKITDVNSDELPIFNIIKNKLSSGSRRGYPTKDNPLYSKLVKIGGQRLAILSYSFEVIISLVLLKMEIAVYETIIEMAAFHSKNENPKSVFAKWWNTQGNSYIPRIETPGFPTLFINIGPNFLLNIGHEIINVYREGKNNPNTIWPLLSLLTPQPEEFLFRISDFLSFGTVSKEEALKEAQRRLENTNREVQDVIRQGEVQRDSQPQPPKPQPTQSKQVDKSKRNTSK